MTANPLRSIILCILTALACQSCRDVPEYPDTFQGNFDALWNIINERYCFLDEKGVNWDSCRSVFAPRAAACTNSEQLFQVCADMLDQLRDGHTNLSAPFATSYYKKWWSDYPCNYNERLIEEYYFNYNYRQLGSITYGLLPSGIGYIRYPSFTQGLGEGNIDWMLSYMLMAPAIIIDVRDNGGGSMTNVDMWVRRFISERTLAGYISHKTGPGHSDFSEPYAYYYEPVGGGHILWSRPVVILADRQTFSAANNFVSVMKSLPNVTVVGSVTGGGSGMPFSSELPNGWAVRFSACSVLDALGSTTEFGVEPTEGCAVDLDPEAALRGHDTILDFAQSLIISGRANGM